MHFFSKLLLTSVFCVILSSPLRAVSITEKIIDSYAQKLGTEPLSCEHETFVRAIAQEMGIAKPIKFRYMNYAALNTFGLYNACAYLDSYVFISKYFFEKLSKEEQRFVIGHELAHIKQHWGKINLPLIYLGIGIPYCSAAGTWYVSHHCSYADKIIRSLAIFIVTSLMAQLSRACILRYCEYDADKTSAHLLNNVQDGISFINHTNNLVNNSPNQKNPDSLPWIKKLFMTLPTHKQRIAYLETCINTKEAP